MKKLLQNTFKTNDELSTLALRLVAGIVFVAYGAQKLFGWFGGYGLEGTGSWMDSIGLSPGYLMALLAGSAEFFGGLLLILGLAVRPAGIALAFTMLIAIVTVHLPNGLFMANNGYAFGLTLLAMSLSLTFSGAGKFSIDSVISKKLNK